MSEKPFDDDVPLKMLFYRLRESTTLPPACLKSSSYLSQESERMKKTTFQHDSTICRKKSVKV
jgi:hypothetical protein